MANTAQTPERPVTPDTPTREPMEPLPCPFCGPTAMTAPFTSKRIAGWITECGSCGAHQNLGKRTAVEAIAAWNRRVLPPPRPAEPTPSNCDGCAQGLPIKDGQHYRDGLPWIGCTASRYAAPLPSGEPTSEAVRHQCPDCGATLSRVTQDADSYLNADQFDSIRAGDWYCDSDKPHPEARRKGRDARYAYYWNRELAHPLPSDAPSGPLRTQWLRDIETLHVLASRMEGETVSVAGFPATVYDVAKSLRGIADTLTARVTNETDPRSGHFIEVLTGILAELRIPRDSTKGSLAQQVAHELRIAHSADPASPPQDAPRLAEVATDKQFSGTWNNWIAPFHRCASCGDSLNWQQSVDVFDRPLITASCACGVMYSARLGEEGLEQARAVDAGNKLAALCAAPAAPVDLSAVEAAIDRLLNCAEDAFDSTASAYPRKLAEKRAAKAALLSLYRTASGVPAKEAGEANNG